MVCKSDYDGWFEHDDETIYFYVESDNKPIKLVKGVEKMGGFFAFYNSKGDAVGTTVFYENFDDMSPVKMDIARKHYLKVIKK